MQLIARERRLRLREPFAIARGTKTEVIVVQVELHANGRVGRGEGVPYPRFGETVEATVADCQRADTSSPVALRSCLEGFATRAARNAVDAALLDWTAATTGKTVPDLLGTPAPDPIELISTIGLGEPEAMSQRAQTLVDGGASLVKVKLGGELDKDRARLTAISKTGAKLWVDANEGWSLESFAALLPVLASAGAVVVEQPVSQALEAELVSMPIPPSVCLMADESFRTIDDLARVQPIYGGINIKLDKAGGLTAAVDIAREARSRGLQIALGCMVSSSLSIAPALLLAPLVDHVDLDGAQWLAEDLPLHGRVTDGQLHPIAGWGGVV